ncbi:hypothetical protein SASPL_127162 [Salvia splendens]|uniref:Protein kinase domain-containing protein n=1 Tax=Salvia splendens TaxID=180675 RepID=A0A8X8XLT1_SALSN|nr:hypothetical protein SASPL_127162 [Salvia splendens]
MDGLRESLSIALTLPPNSKPLPLSYLHSIKKTKKPQEAELPIPVPDPILQYYMDRSGWTKPEFLLGRKTDHLEGQGASSKLRSALRTTLNIPDSVLDQKGPLPQISVASAIPYLHDACSPHVVHADIKPSNVLLDDDLNCKLCDFGSASVRFSTAVAPRKNDVYNFEVVVLELIIGIEAFCPAT